MLAHIDSKPAEETTVGRSYSIRLFASASLLLQIALLAFTPLTFADDVRAQNIHNVHIDIHVSDASTEDIFRHIEAHSRFSFIYTSDLVDSQPHRYRFDRDSVSVAGLLQTLAERARVWFWQNNATIAVSDENKWRQHDGGYLICPSACDSSSRRIVDTGAISGTVVDGSTNNPIFGATVQLAGTSTGDATDEAGRFLIRKIPAGAQQFIIRFLGYKTYEFEREIIAGDTIEVSIELEPDVYEGDGIIVYSQAEGQAQAIREQISSTSIVNVVSETKIRELPDANAAESVGRLPGISVIRDSGEGQRIAIRGLAPRYNSITLDGDRLPSSDQDGRAVNLNMISPEMLWGIEVFKAILPDMDADAIGGSVNFKFAGVPDRSALRASVSAGYNDHINGLGSYNLSVNGSRRLFNQKIGALLSLDLESNDRSSDSFNGSYQVLRDPREGEVFAPIGVTSIRLSDREETRERLGAGLILDLRLPNGKIVLNNFASRLNRDIANQSRVFNVDTFAQQYRLNIVESQSDVLSSRLSGSHSVFGSTVEWKLSRNLSRLTTPYDHSVGFEELGAFIAAELDETRGPELIPNAATNDLQDTHFDGSTFTDTENKEIDYVTMLDVTVPFQAGYQFGGRIKFGGKYTSKDRFRTGNEWAIRSGDAAFIYNNEERDWVFTNTGRLSIENYLDQEFEASEFLDGTYSMPVGLDEQAIRDLWSTHEEQHIERLTIVFDDQDAIERVTAGYAYGEFNIGDRLAVLPGARYEYTDSRYTAKRGEITGSYRNVGSIADTVATQTFGMFFPMVHARYRATNWLDVRAAYTETISRPNFSELLPREEISANNRNVKRGTPGLKPASATNVDLFFTAFSNRIGLFSVGGFHKRIDQLIYSRKAVVLDPESLGLPMATRGYDLFEVVNNPRETTVRGFEIEWQSNLIHLPVPFNGLVVNVNYARIWSETQYPQFFLERTEQGIVGVEVFRDGPMINQPDYVLNVSVGYDFKKVSTRISMVYQGATLNAIGERQETDSFTEAFMRWDGAIKYAVTPRISVFTNVQNINNEPDLANQFSDRFATYQQYYAWSVEAGLRMSIY